ncbi:enoyl-CoA hydratase/isomerase family protein [bacterium]|nr:enoyl-CoA hydratase/isomerase family protein [candidate division CSSED10-310 bacterium]
MEAFETIVLSFKDHIARLTLNRSEVRNAFNDKMVHELRLALGICAAEGEARILVLTGADPAFCAGADYAWMQKMVDFDQVENVRDAAALAALFEHVSRFPKPTIARVNGHAMGGGLGLAAACDLVVASEDAQFGFPEVRLGLVPATISPYVMERMGAAACRRYFLTGERFPAVKAFQMGLVDELAPAKELDAAVAKLTEHLLHGGSRAQSACKELIRRVRGEDLERVNEYTAGLIARLRVGAEGQEGLRAALARRRPAWREE